MTEAEVFGLAAAEQCNGSDDDCDEAHSLEPCDGVEQP